MPWFFAWSSEKNSRFGVLRSFEEKIFLHSRHRGPQEYWMYSKDTGGCCGGKDSFKTEQIPMGYRPKGSFFLPVTLYKIRNLFFGYVADLDFLGFSVIITLYVKLNWRYFHGYQGK